MFSSWLIVLVGCVGSPEIDAGGPVLDFHSHCPPSEPTCDVSSLESARGGEVTAVVAGLSHYGIASTLGDPLPEEASHLLGNNNAVLEVSGSANVLLMPSLDCLQDTSGSDPNFTAACLEDADRWISLGAVGFKDHAGKTYDGDGLDLGLWVGAYNRLAGWCTVEPDELKPNRACLSQRTLRMPLEVPAYREVIRAVVQDREKVWLTHAVPWVGSEEQCGGPEVTVLCHARAADALVDFAVWAEAELPLAARRRIVLAHLGFMQGDDRLLRVLDAGLSTDIAQTSILGSGCEIRGLIGAYPEQVVFGSDLFHGLDCVERHYDPWVYALLGPAGKKARYAHTCRGTVKPVGAELNSPSACGMTVPDGAGRAVLYGNAATLLGL